MRALVIYESMYGNTKTIATAIADGLRSAMDVDLVEVGAAPATVGEDVEVLVVGAPTHAHGLSKPETRKRAAANAEGGLVSPGIGLREWLADLEAGSPSVAAAAFDTTLKGPRLLWGSAAEAVDRRLHKLGFDVVDGPESFHVGGPLGPVYDVLEDGEVERAQAWGEAIAAKVRSRTGVGA